MSERLSLDALVLVLVRVLVRVLVLVLVLVLVGRGPIRVGRLLGRLTGAGYS